jgi:hypothetical protein
VDGSGEGSRVLGNCGRHDGVVVGYLYFLGKFDGNAGILQDVVKWLEVILYTRKYVRTRCKKVLPS